MKFFTDIDGVILGREPNTPDVTLAHSAREYLEYALENFDCYWLSTHSNGGINHILDYLSVYADSAFIELARQIEPATFCTLKTEALPLGEPFLWVDDKPISSEIKFLEDNNLMKYWFEVDTRKNINALVGLIESINKLA